jgi:ribosome-associated protein
VSAANKPAPAEAGGQVSAARATGAPPLDFVLRGDFIALDALLKATGLAPSGGAAKAMVAEGSVQVDGQTELRKTCKIRAGQVVAVDGARVRVLSTPAPG